MWEGKHEGWKENENRLLLTLEKENVNHGISNFNKLVKVEQNEFKVSKKKEIEVVEIEEIHTSTLFPGYVSIKYQSVIIISKEKEVHKTLRSGIKQEISLQILS